MARTKRSGLLYRQAQVRGLLGGSKPWTYLWVLLAARRLLKRLTRDEPEVVYSEDLLPGQAIIISATDHEPRIFGA